MVAVDYLVGDNSTLAEIIWTGPANGRFPVRRIDQVLYDLIANANHRIVLVTFAAHRVQHLCDHLTQAVRRGVERTLIVEGEEESEGRRSRMFRSRIPASTTGRWPNETGMLRGGPASSM